MKYVPSVLGVGQLSGKAGNNVASRNRNGAYIRIRVQGTNPATTLQVAARNTLSTYSSAWRALSEAQRSGWTTLGGQITRNDRLGQAYTLTGVQAYVGVNRNLVTVGGTPLSTAPNISTVPASLASATVTATSV